MLRELLNTQNDCSLASARNWTRQQKGEGFEYHILAVALAFLILVRDAGYF